MLASPSLIMGGLRVSWGQEEPFSASRAGSKGCWGLGEKLAQVGKYIPGFPWIFHSLILRAPMQRYNSRLEDQAVKVTRKLF